MNRSFRFLLISVSLAFFFSGCNQKPDVVGPELQLNDSSSVTSKKTVKPLHQLIFWNTLDSVDDIVNSEVGVQGSFPVSSDELASYIEPVQIGNGVGDFSSSSIYIAYDNLFGGAPYSQFAIEYWLKKGSVADNEYDLTISETPDSWGGYNNTMECGQGFVADNGDGTHNVNFFLTVHWTYSCVLVYIWNVPSIQVGSVHHVAYSVDLNKGDNNRIEFYLDGVKMGPPNVSHPERDASSQPTWTPASYFRIGCSASTSLRLGNLIDDLKVWSYAKKNF